MPRTATDNVKLTTDHGLVSCRLFIDPPRSGVENMAIDEALLEQAANDGRASLRFYRWSEPTLSLGYFQSVAERVMHAASRQLPIVRRPSGGGALIHDRELTYCLCLPASHPQSRQSASLYGMAHSALIGALAEQGVRSQLHAETAIEAPTHDASDQPFLCFGRRHAADVVMPCGDTAAKVAGSAQRRRVGAILQHGSVLLENSAWAPELAGLDSSQSIPIATQTLISAWTDRLARKLAIVWEPARIESEVSTADIERLVTKYASGAWLTRR